MAYGVYFANLTEENSALLLTLLRLKKEAGRLEAGEEELLAQMRGQEPPARKATQTPRKGPSAEDSSSPEEAPTEAKEQQ